MTSGYWTTDPIAVMGRSDTRSEVVGVITPTGKGGKIRERSDLSRRFIITLSKSPVGNFFERKTEWTRQQQIDAYRQYVWNEWIQNGNIPEYADKWLRARAAEVNAGKLIDLISYSRQFSRKPGVLISKSAPYDCHGHVIRAMILILAGQLKKEDYFSAQKDYLNEVEGPPSTV